MSIDDKKENNNSEVKSDNIKSEVKSDDIKSGDVSSYSLMNWPPSRGPMPEWMTKKPEYIYPDSERIIIERPIVKEDYAEAEKEAIKSIRSGVKKFK